jgi:hypothetical protein
MKPMRKEIADLIREAMELHELARNFYHRLAHQGIRLQDGPKKA